MSNEVHGVFLQSLEMYLVDHVLMTMEFGKFLCQN